MRKTVERPTIPGDFSESEYLAANPDVAAAVAAGMVESGAKHWLSFGWREGRPLGASVNRSNPLLRFETRAPSNQTAVDLFRNCWASDLASVLGVDGTGSARLFADDNRPAQAAAAFGHGGRIDGMTVLELGPLEGAHTYALERLGAASIDAVESNAEAYLKCLIIKELLPLSSHFLFGDAIKFLEATAPNYDLIFCSGILYHMENPLRMIELVCKATDRCFVWTHYYSPQRHLFDFKPAEAECAGFSATYWGLAYGDQTNKFWGGNKTKANWLERKSLFDAFARFGLDEVVLTEEMPDHPHGPAITFAVQRKGT